MKWIYLVLPIAFVLMTIRIIQVNYSRIVHDLDPEDPGNADPSEDAKTGSIAKGEPISQKPIAAASRK